MKTERKSNKIGYIYLIVILEYIVGEKKQMPRGFIIVHPYFKQHMDDAFLLYVLHKLVVTCKISTIYSYTGVKNISYLNQEESKTLLHVHLQCGIF